MPGWCRSTSHLQAWILATETARPGRRGSRSALLARGQGSWLVLAWRQLHSLISGYNTCFFCCYLCLLSLLFFVDYLFWCNSCSKEIVFFCRSWNPGMRFGGSLKTGPKANCDSWKRKFPWADLQRPAKTNTMTMTNTFREHSQRGIFEDIQRTPSNANFTEIPSLTQTKLTIAAKSNNLG